jgi:hypothetical protein
METVGNIFRRARAILQERSPTGTRWTNAELLDWLNEAYVQIVSVKPDANAGLTEHTCAAGTRQTITGLRVLDVVRCLDGSRQGITKTLRDVLDTARRRWHSEPETVDIEMFVFDEALPEVFYTYPPARVGARLEVLQSTVPAPHTEGSQTSVEQIRLADTYAPVLLDYVLWRAFSKDAENPGNANRAALHERAWMGVLGLKSQGDQAVSPNNEVRRGA